MTVMTIEEIRGHLPEVIAGLGPGEEILLTQNGRALARLVGEAAERPRPVFGRGSGKVVIVAEDDEHLEGFEDPLP